MIKLGGVFMKGDISFLVTVKLKILSLKLTFNRAG